MSVSDTTHRTVRDLFESFEQQGLPYVVLRGHEALPAGVAGSDLDLLVGPAVFKEAVELCSRKFDPAESTARGALDLLAVGIKQPRRAIAFTVDSPGEALAFVEKSLGTAEFSDRKYVQRTFVDGDLSVDLVNHLAYTSTLDGSMIRVDPAVEQAMLARRTRSDGVYVPAPPDELAHLVCRGIYDYDGVFPDRYERRCDRLSAVVRDDDSMDGQFRALLSRLFYDADKLVYELVATGEYDSIRDRLRRYSDY